MTLYTDLTSFTKINSEQRTKYKHKTIKLLEDNIEKDLDDLRCSNDVLDPIPKVQSMTEIIDNYFQIID